MTEINDVLKKDNQFRKWGEVTVESYSENVM